MAIRVQIDEGSGRIAIHCDDPENEHDVLDELVAELTAEFAAAGRPVTHTDRYRG